MRKFDPLGFILVSISAGLLSYLALPHILHNPIHLGIWQMPYAILAGIVIGFVFAWE